VDYAFMDLRGALRRGRANQRIRRLLSDSGRFDHRKLITNQPRGFAQFPSFAQFMGGVPVDAQALSAANPEDPAATGTSNLRAALRRHHAAHESGGIVQKIVN
jgi:hypothetical protein